MKNIKEKIERQQVISQKENLVNLLANANERYWGEIDDLISEYSPISNINDIPNEMLPELINKITKALGKGLFKKVINC